MPVLGLSYAECAELAAQHEVRMAPATLEHLVDAGRGNPLAIIENLAGGSGRSPDRGGS